MGEICLVIVVCFKLVIEVVKRGDWCGCGGGFGIEVGAIVWFSSGFNGYVFWIYVFGRFFFILGLWFILINIVGFKGGCIDFGFKF